VQPGRGAVENNVGLVEPQDKTPELTTSAQQHFVRIWAIN
jgi:hypothetical protein